jgi:hypothetical protein
MKYYHDFEVYHGEETPSKKGMPAYLCSQGNII